MNSDGAQPLTVPRDVGVVEKVEKGARQVERDIEALVAGRHGDPHRLLGPHDGVVRTWRPGATAVALSVGGQRLPMHTVHPDGLFEVICDVVATPTATVDYQFEVEQQGGTFVDGDPYRFWPTVGEVDIHLFGEGLHYRLWDRLGAHPMVHQGTWGTSFALWAPSAVAVRVVGDFNGWDGRVHPMRMLGSSGIWEIFLPGVAKGARYKFEVAARDGSRAAKADPFAFAAEVPPATASVVDVTEHQWTDGDWLAKRAAGSPLAEPMSIYECHLGSWRTVPAEGDRSLTYRELAEVLPAYVAELGFTHVELMPVAEHPFSGSWGYQVTSYFAPTSRFGSPDDFRALVDAFHARGIGVIVDWVPAHFPKDAFALARFDGTALYEHADPRQGEHPDWGTLVFNFGRNEVANFLIANALYWIGEFHVDGLRVDAVASMLYLDYSREPGEWVPNQFGGRENLEAVAFMRRLNEVVHVAHPGVMIAAEESTAWPGVSRPTYAGGLGFGSKWNMGWMHDTLVYFATEPISRRFHHYQLTFGLLYAFSENFVLPLSHDEVVHGKGSLLNKMPGDRSHQMANLRALLGWMWAHPGKQLVFMGAELAQEREWSHERSLDWHLLEHAEHRGVSTLVAAMNRIYRETPALWEVDFESAGFSWIDADGADANVFAFARYARRAHDLGAHEYSGGQVLVCVSNLSGSNQSGYRVGLPRAGRWQVALDSSDARFGGWRAHPLAEYYTAPDPWQGHDQSVVMDLYPLSVVWLVWTG